MIRATSTARRLIEKLQAQMERTHNLQQPLQRSGELVSDASVKRFTNNDWAANAQSTIEKKGSSKPGIDSGRLRQSIQVSPPSSSEVTIGTNVKYAKWFQDGTGIFAGHSEWTIKPKNKKALAFTIGGVTYLRREVTMKGQPGRAFLDESVVDSVRSQITATFESWIMRGTL